MDTPRPTQPDWPRDGLAAILFDLDGVILDSMPWHIRAWREIFAGLGVEVEEEFLYLNEGAIEASHLEEMVAALGVAREPGWLARLLPRQAELFQAKYAGRVKPFADAPPVLDRFGRSGLRLALVTSSRRAVVERCLPAGLLARFEVLISGDEVRQGKPHPEPYLTGLARLGLEPALAVAVENAPAGISSARAAGLTCLALATTLSPRHLGGAAGIYGSLTELAEAVLDPRKLIRPSQPS
jgi:beta-phosphoglucomutase